MELRDYLLMLRRGWLTILAFTVAGLIVGVGYTASETDEYSTTAVILVSPENAQSLSELQSGTQYAVSVAPTYAQVIVSPRVLGPAAERLGVNGIGALPGSVVAAASEGTGLIGITATADSGREAAELANATATSAVEVIPDFTGLDDPVPSAINNASRDSAADQALAPQISVRVIQSAGEPSTPLGVSSSRILAVLGLIGLVLGVAVTITWQSLDTRIRRPKDLAALTNLPLFGQVPRLRRRQRSGVVVQEDPASAVAEAFRSLRTNIGGLEAGGRRSLLVTSVASDRLGAQVPVNLAWSIAQTGRRVLLIDLDLRHSPVRELVHPSAAAGVGDVLAESNLLLTDVTQETSQPHLQVVLSGTPQPRPSDLLSSKRMRELLSLAEQAYDYVVLHAPPLLTCSDAAALSRMVQHTLVTVSAGQTREPQLAEALGVLANVQVEPLGLVLTGSRTYVGEVSRDGGVLRHRFPGTPVQVVSDPGTSEASLGSNRPRRRAGS